MNDECEKLKAEKHDIFYSVVAKIIYTMKRAIQDPETVIDFLCPRVSKSDCDDCKKLCRVIDFTTDTMYKIRIIGAYDLRQIFTWINVSYTVNPDTRS